MNEEKLLCLTDTLVLELSDELVNLWVYTLYFQESSHTYQRYILMILLEHLNFYDDKYRI